MNQKAAWRAGVVLAALVALRPVTGAEGDKPPAKHTYRVLSSYYDLPDGVKVLRSFSSDGQEIIKKLREHGITVAPLPGKRGHAFGFVGPCLVVEERMHGTADAPFAGTQFTIQHPTGVKFTFDRPQAVVGMTVSGDIGTDLWFYDVQGKLIEEVNADTHHVEDLGFDSRGAVFRGLAADEPIIASMHFVPTRIPPNANIVFATIDYFCLSASAEPDAEKTRMATVEALAAKLGDERYKTREEASEKLCALSPSYLRVLRKVEAGDDPEVQLRLARVIQSLESKKKENLTPKGTADGKDILPAAEQDGK